MEWNEIKREKQSSMLKVLGLFLLSYSVGFGQSYLLPLNSINYMRYLDKQEFFQMFPSEVIDAGKEPTQEGYYILYQHESLRYYFGPEKSDGILQSYKRELDDVVSIVKNKREHLVSAQTSIIQLPRELNPSSTNSAPQSANQSGTNLPLPPIEPWWRKVFRIFGF